MTFEQIIWAFPLAALTNRLVVEVWFRSRFFNPSRVWLRAREGIWLVDVFLSPRPMSGVIGGLITVAMFASMKGLDSTYAQTAFVYAVALIALPQVLLPFEKL